MKIKCIKKSLPPMLRDVYFPSGYFDALSKIAKNYGAKVKFAEYDEDNAGSYDKERRLIKIYMANKDSNFVTLNYVLGVFFHELAHHIQHRKRKKLRTIEDVLVFEQEACNNAIHLAKKHSPDFPIEGERYIDAFYDDGKPLTDDFFKFAKYHHKAYKRSYRHVLKRFVAGKLHPQIYKKAGLHGTT